MSSIKNLRARGQILQVAGSRLALQVKLDNDTIDVGVVQVLGDGEQLSISDRILM